MSHLLPQYLIDTHAHLNFSEFAGEVPEILEKAKVNGVEKIICVGTDFETNKQVFDLSKKYLNVFSTIGFHPIYVQNYQGLGISKIVEKLEKQIKKGNPVALGEIGLDYFRRDDKTEQKMVFKAILDLAVKYNLPVIIHCREAFEEMFEILENYADKICGVLHCFTGGVDEANKAIELGLHIGFTGLITYKNNDHVLEALKIVPLKKVLIETDSPYLAPVPMRGNRNEPAFVKYVAQKVAEVRRIEFTEVAEATSRNAEKLFGLILKEER